MSLDWNKIGESTVLIVPTVMSGSGAWHGRRGWTLRMGFTTSLPGGERAKVKGEGVRYLYS